MKMLSLPHNFRFEARLEFQHDGISLIGFARDERTNALHIVQPLTVTTFPDADYAAVSNEPRFCIMGKDSAQSLVDELWRVGVRPSEATGSAGMIGAVQAHLKDLREIARHALGMKE